MDRIVLMLW